MKTKVSVTDFLRVVILLMECFNNPACLCSLEVFRALSPRVVNYQQL